MARIAVGGSCGRFAEKDLPTSRASPLSLLALAVLTLVSSRASARDFPFLALRSAQGAAIAAPWEAPQSLEIAEAPQLDSTLLYELIAYVTKEVLDDESDEYRSSPVGAYLRRATPAEYARSSQPSATPILFIDSPSSLRYRVRDGTALGDLWSALQRREVDRSGLSFNPKLGAGKAGFVLSLRW